MKYIVDFQKAENLCCCNRKEFKIFDEFYPYVIQLQKEVDNEKQNYLKGGLYGLDGIEFSKKVPDIIAKGNAEKIANQPNIDFIRSYDDSALIKEVWDDKKRNWIVTAFKDKESLNKSINRTPDIVNNQNGMAPPLNLNKDNNIIMSSYNNLNPSHQSIQKPLSHNEWLEELKRKRKKGWWQVIQ